MRLRATRALAALLAAGLVSVALAQQPPPGGPPPGGLPTPELQRAVMIQNKSVQEEVKVTPEQDEQLRKAARTFEAKHKEEMTQAQQNRDFRKQQELNRQALEALGKAMGDVLKPGQLKRLDQIALQSQGVWALVQSQVQKKLELSDKQKQEVRSIATGLDKDVKAAIQDAGRDPQQQAAAYKKLVSLNKEALSRAAALLDDGQKKAWRELTGEPFEPRVETPPRQPGGQPGRP
jgi:hypothetical protein